MRQGRAEWRLPVYRLSGGFLLGMGVFVLEHALLLPARAAAFLTALFLRFLPAGGFALVFAEGITLRKENTVVFR